MIKFEEELNNLPVSKSTNYTEYWNKAQLLTVFKDWQPQKTLPVVPECVDKWYKFHIDGTFSAVVSAYAFNGADEEVIWIAKNGGMALICKMYLYGYTVEKPKLYYLKHIDMSKEHNDVDWYLVNDGELDHDFEYKGLSPKQDRYKFTQKEIDSMQTGSYEQIDVPVEDGE